MGCERCGGTGFVIERMLMSTFWERYRKNVGHYLYGNRDWEDDFAVPCPKCAGGLERKSMLIKKFAGFPSALYDKRYSEFDWNVYDKDEAMKREAKSLKAIVDSFIEKYEEWEKAKTGLYIWNKIKGSGKTFLASCICNELISKYYIGTKFVSAADLFEIAKAEYPDERTEEDRKPIKRLYNCKLLVIDDLGQKNCGHDWMEDILFKILDERMNNERITIITSNIPIDELPFDERATDRLNKMCYSLELPGKGVRSQQTFVERKELFEKVGLIPTRN